MDKAYRPRKDSLRIETRDDSGGVTISGYAAVFYREGEAGTQYQIWRNEDVFERIAPVAFNRALAEKHDVRGLFNHREDNILGKTGSGTVRLSVDERGLKYEIDPPNTAAGRDVTELLKRGDIDGSSFAFTVEGETWSRESDGREIRTITDVNLYDVGPVTYPAYESSTSGVRSAVEARASYDSWHAKRRADQSHRAQLAKDELTALMAGM